MERRLYRSRTDSILGGVAGGLAAYMNADPALVRVAWAVLIVVTGGLAFVAYLVGWVVIPEEPRGSAPESGAVTSGTYSSGERPRRSGQGVGFWFGGALILLGVWLLARPYLPSLNWNLVWPVVIVVIGAVILLGALRRRED